MKFKIILHEYDSIKKPNWHLTGEYSLAFNIPLSYLSAAKKNMKIDSDLVRRQGAEVHYFLISLNKAYY